MGCRNVTHHNHGEVAFLLAKEESMVKDKRINDKYYYNFKTCT